LPFIYFFFLTLQHKNVAAATCAPFKERNFQIAFADIQNGSQNLAVSRNVQTEYLRMLTLGVGIRSYLFEQAPPSASEPDKHRIVRAFLHLAETCFACWRTTFPSFFKG